MNPRHKNSRSPLFNHFAAVVTKVFVDLFGQVLRESAGFAIFGFKNPVDKALGLLVSPVKFLSARDVDFSRWTQIYHLLGNMVFQSFFMLMTTQPFFFASSINDCGNVPNLVSDRPLAGP